MEKTVTTATTMMNQLLQTVPCQQLHHRQLHQWL
jgi:hypothetical protein